MIGRSAEISLGREGAQEYERGAAVDVDPVMTARVRRIGHRLIAACEAPPYPFEFHAVDANTVNAFALPGGFIYIFRGLTQLVPGDDALAFILAHEIAHVTRRHGVRQLEKSLAISGFLDFALGGSMATIPLQLLIDMHYSRGDEAEADRLGLEMMARAGFDPTQGAEAMAVLARAAKSGRSIPPFLRSHPLPESRIAALKRQAEAMRAAPRPPRAAPPAPLPAPPDLTSAPASIARSPFFPLQVGQRWTYRVMEAGKRRTYTTTALEEQPGRDGVFRVRSELDGDLATTRLMAVTEAGVCSRAEGGGRRADAGPFRSRTSPPGPLSSNRGWRGGTRGGGLPSPAAVGGEGPGVRRERDDPGADVGWQAEIRLPANVTLASASGAMETVRVPAGEFRAVRAVQRSSSGEVATVWLAPGVGIVRRVWERTGLVEELESLHRPAPDEDPSDGAKTGAAGEARRHPK